MTRNYTAAIGDDRCLARRAPLRGDAKTKRPQCMRRAVNNGYCAQHWAIEESRLIDAEQQAGHDRDVMRSLNRYR